MDSLDDSNDNFPLAECANFLVKSQIEQKRLDRIKDREKEAQSAFLECKQKIIRNTKNGSFETHCSMLLLKDHLDFFRSKGYTVKTKKINNFDEISFVRSISSEK